MEHAVTVERHESRLGRWTQTQVQPAAFSGVVTLIWHFRGWMSTPRERIFADGSYEVIVHLGPVYRSVAPDGRTTAFPGACFTGLRLGPEVIEAPAQATEVLGIRLTPAGAYALCGALHETADLTVGLDGLLPGAAELSERCGAAADGAGCIRAAAGWLAERLARGHRQDRAVAWAARRIECSAGTASIGGLRAASGMSRTRFTRLFREQMGVTPKVFARVHRFRHALAELLRDGSALSDVALSCGYYDQAHFHGEFRGFTGFTPATFLAAERYPSSVHVAEGAP